MSGLDDGAAPANDTAVPNGSAAATDAAAPTPAPTPTASDLLSFYRLVGQLKTTKRRGWELRDVPQPESIADHMYRMSLISLTLPDAADQSHLVKLALAHDLAEALVGDITPADNVPAATKQRLEHDAMVSIRDERLAGSPVGHELFALWAEYDAAATPAARIVKQIDKLELLVQADEYERLHSIDLSEFFQRALSEPDLFVHPALRGVADSLLAERAKRRAGADAAAPGA